MRCSPSSRCSYRRRRPRCFAVAVRRNRCPKCRRTRRFGVRVSGSGQTPASSIASQATSSSQRCWGSMRTASRGEMPQNAASNVREVVDEAAAAHHHGASGGGIGMIEAIDVPTVGRHIADAAAAVRSAATRTTGIVRPAGKAAANTYDRDRFNPPSRLAH